MQTRTRSSRFLVFSLAVLALSASPLAAETARSAPPDAITVSSPLDSSSTLTIFTIRSTTMVSTSFSGTATSVLEQADKYAQQFVGPGGNAETAANKRLSEAAKGVIEKIVADRNDGASISVSVSGSETEQGNGTGSGYLNIGYSVSGGTPRAASGAQATSATGAAASGSPATGAASGAASGAGAGQSSGSSGAPS
jgi:hypothetical protein